MSYVMHEFSKIFIDKNKQKIIYINVFRVSTDETTYLKINLKIKIMPVRVCTTVLFYKIKSFNC